MEYYESAAYGKVCETVYGIDLKQRGTMTKAQLDLLCKESAFDESQHVLEVGCGAGQVAAYISEKTSARFTCIDVDEKAIAWAKAASKDNARVEYRVHDVRNILELPQKFDKILAIDSLYFVSNMQAETFMGALKKTVEDLYSLLKDGGELAIFYSELPFFVPERKAPECTQLGICLQELGYSYRAFDLTEGEVAFWKDFKAAHIRYEQDFVDEDAKDMLDAHIGEASFFLEGAEHNRLYRNLYLVKAV